MSHTPGPWAARNGIGQYAYEVVGKSPRGKDVVTARVAGGADHREANARLIAAAPELLEALKSAYDDLREANPLCVRLSMYRAAIAKATGETP